MSGYSHGGASLTKKTLKAWTTSHWSAKEDIDHNLKTLRDRAADLAMNSPVGAAAINTEVTNVVGTGLKVFPRIRYEELGMTAEQARDWSRHTKREFELWANSLRCDFLRRNTFGELQAIGFRSYLFDGDCFCLLKRRPVRSDMPYSLRLQLLEAQRISNPIGANAGAVGDIETLLQPSGNRVVNGIEVNKDGQLEAIWVCNKIWNEPTTTTPELKWQRVRMFGKDTGCRNVLHICRDVRPDQFRGVPFLAPVIETIKQMSRYAEAELTSAVVKSYFSIFFVQPLNNNDFNQILGEGEDDGAPCVDANEYKLGSATIAALPRGVDVKAIDSSNAQSTFEVFTNAFLMQVGAALNIPFELLVKKFQSSYSASRAALLQAEDEFRQRKAAFVTDFCQPVYEEFLSEAVALGRIDAPGFFDDPLTKSLWTSAQWYNERSGILDPVKEMQGVQLRLALGLSTHEKEASEVCGLDFWENLGALTEEEKAIQTAIPTLANSAPAAVPKETSSRTNENSTSDSTEDEQE